LLGGITPKMLTTSDDLNKIAHGEYMTLNTNNPVNTPNVDNCYNNRIWCFQTSGRVLQILFSYNLSAFFFRRSMGSDQTWSQWFKI